MYIYIHLHTHLCVCVYIHIHIHTSVCVPLYLSTSAVSAAQVIGSPVVQLFVCVEVEDLECFTAAAARRELQNPSPRITAFPSRRAAVVFFCFVFFFPPLSAA